MRSPRQFAMLALVPVLALVAGCSAGPSRSDAARMWRVSHLPRPEQRHLMTVAAPGESPCPAALRSLLQSRLAAAADSPLPEKALMLADLGMQALHEGALEEARPALDGALAIMAATIADPAMVKKVSGLSGAEGLKVFQGEPHERAVVHLYRGLLYLAEGDPDNALACFKAAELQDVRSSGPGGYWLSSRYLQAATLALCLKQPPPANLVGLVPGQLVGETSDTHNALLVVAAGLAPRKVTAYLGPGQYRLAYRPVHSLVCDVRLRTDPGGGDGSSASPGSASWLVLRRPSEDIYRQAASRDRREMDQVLEAKKDKAGRLERDADAVERVGSYAGHLGIYGMPVVLGTAVVASLAREQAAGAETDADLRQLATIPGRIYLGTFRCTGQPLVVQVTGPMGKALCSRTITVSPPGPNRLSIVLVRIYD